MGLTLLGALLILGLALFIQTPALARRNGLPFSVRTLTGYAFALILLAIGFFVAGVPVGQTTTPTVTTNLTATPTSQFDNVVILPSPTSAETEVEVTTPPLTPITGAFGGPPPTQITPTLTTTLTLTEEPTADEDETVTATATARPTNTPSATSTASPTTTASPTPTITPSPTPTPTPTWTPTPITGPTAQVASNGSTLFVRRYPGGTETITFVNDGDTVLLLPGRANQGGILWQEISTVNGIEGWVPYELLDFGNS